MLKKIWTYLTIVAVALLAAVCYELFVFPNQFAPSGVNGICTMIQYVTGVSLGYLSLLINLPLAVWVYFAVSKSLAVRSMVYVSVFSVALVLLDNVDFSAFAYATANGTSRIIGPLTAGIIMGFCYSVLLNASAFTGGADFISALIHKNHPELKLFSMIFLMNSAVAVASYFVYGYQMEPVLMCILYSFTSTTVGDYITRMGRSAVRFEIVTDRPEQIGRDIIRELGHSATMLPGTGMYSGKPTHVLVCVVNRPQASRLCALLRSYPHTFAVMDNVSEVVGNFKHISTSGREVSSMLDKGDGENL